jgi:hypothetical protein
MALNGEPLEAYRVNLVGVRRRRRIFFKNLKFEVVSRIQFISLS